MKKNIVFGPNKSISRWIYTDIINDCNSEYCDLSGTTSRMIDKILYSRKFQQALPHWMKKKLYKHLLGYDFLSQKSDGDNVVFLFTCQYTMFFMTCFWTFVSFLKKEYPKARFAFYYYYDIIYTCCPELVERVKAEFSSVLTFDPGDAEKYDIEYYGEICSYNEPQGDESIKPFDIFYAGGDRGRFDIILSSFRKLTDLGYSCIFYLVDIAPANFPKICAFFKIDKFNANSGAVLHYKQSTMNCNVYCPYPSTLNHISKCKALFEVVFPGQTSSTLRLPQAFLYGKKLITNCKYVTERYFYSPSIISVFETPEDIDASFIGQANGDCNINFSPLALISHIRKTL